MTAPHVQWMFAQRLAGRSVASIALELTELGVPCPSDADPERNRHRAGGPWQLRTVAVILGNPRYTGREVWDPDRWKIVYVREDVLVRELLNRYPLGQEVADDGASADMVTKLRSAGTLITHDGTNWDLTRA